MPSFSRESQFEHVGSAANRARARISGTVPIRVPLLELLNSTHHPDFKGSGSRCPRVRPADLEDSASDGLTTGFDQEGSGKRNERQSWRECSVREVDATLTT